MLLVQTPQYSSILDSEEGWVKANRNETKMKDPTNLRQTPSLRDTAFQTMQLIKKQEHRVKEAEEDDQAGVEPGMGISEARRKQLTLDTEKSKKLGKIGQQREAVAHHNLTVSALLDEIQQDSKNLPPLPADTNLGRIRNLLRPLGSINTEMLDLALRA